MFNILAKAQIQQEEENGNLELIIGSSEGLGISFKELFTKASDAFLATNLIAFKSLLHEFTEHEVIKSRKQSDGSQILYIPLSKALLQDLLDQ